MTIAGYPNYFKVNGTGTGHSSQMTYMQTMVNYIIQAISAVKQDKSIKAIEPKKILQDQYVAEMKKDMQKNVWQTGDCKAFYRKNMTAEVTSLSPESVVRFIFSRKRFNLGDYNVLR